jgi:hypothetical protein
MPILALRQSLFGFDPIENRPRLRNLLFQTIPYSAVHATGAFRLSTPLGRFACSMASANISKNAWLVPMPRTSLTHKLTVVANVSQKINGHDETSSLSFTKMLLWPA